MATEKVLIFCDLLPILCKVVYNKEQRDPFSLSLYERHDPRGVYVPKARASHKLAGDADCHTSVRTGSQ